MPTFLSRNGHSQKLTHGDILTIDDIPGQLGSLQRIAFRLHWETVRHKANSEPADVNLAVLLYDRQRRHVETVWHQSPQNLVRPSGSAPAVMHGGSKAVCDPKDKRDGETVAVDVLNLPPDLAIFYIVAVSDSSLAHKLHRCSLYIENFIDDGLHPPGAVIDGYESANCKYRGDTIQGMDRSLILGKLVKITDGSFFFYRDGTPTHKDMCEIEAECTELEQKEFEAYCKVRQRVWRHLKVPDKEAPEEYTAKTKVLAWLERVPALSYKARRRAMIDDVDDLTYVEPLDPGLVDRVDKQTFRKRVKEYDEEVKRKNRITREQYDNLLAKWGVESGGAKEMKKYDVLGSKLPLIILLLVVVVVVVVLAVVYG